MDASRVFSASSRESFFRDSSGSFLDTSTIRCTKKRRSYPRRATVSFRPFCRSAARFLPIPPPPSPAPWITSVARSIIKLNDQVVLESESVNTRQVSFSFPRKLTERRISDRESYRSNKQSSESNKLQLSRTSITLTRCHCVH